MRWTKTPEERFRDKFIMGSKLDCWVWTGSKDQNGYGMFWFDGRVQRASRVSWQLYNKEQIPTRSNICHRCDNPSCVNPNHLFLGTYSDNLQDCWDKRRRAAPMGVLNPKAKLTEEQVREIKQSNLTSTELSRLYPVSRQQISYIRHGKKWPHV